MGVLAGSGIGQATAWQAALDAALISALEPLGQRRPDLLVMFANDAFRDAYPALLRAAADRSAAREIVGCSASGVIGFDRELEGQPAIGALAVCFPKGAALTVQHITQDDVVRDSWLDQIRLEPTACTGLVVLADPFSLDAEALIRGLERDYPKVTIVGGLASGNSSARRASVFASGQVHYEGAVVIALSGSVALRAVVSQGCEPIGQPWTVTEVAGHVIRRIGNRPAYDVLRETIAALAEPERSRAAHNLLVGLAMNEYRDEFERGDFLIRNLLGVDPASGAVAIGARPQVGQTIQFQVRDARAADDELRHLLGEMADELDAPPAAALLFACNGRGAGLFGGPDHDVRAVRDLLGEPAIAGFFCNGEIGPVGQSVFLHGFTASLGLFVPR